ncbi:MAG: hypothetical protein KBD53_09045 [Candidatus Omnitrophica bacterium]|nr:hypothetical protein [Candidatus Omnitrophota bacterium]
MNVLKIYFVLFFSFFVFVCPSVAEETAIPPDIIEICNHIVKNIYDGIEKLKPQYHDLELFTLIALKRNQWGFDYIKYQYIDMVGSTQVDQLEFRVEFLPIDVEQDSPSEGIHFEYDFPLLKIKLIVYQSHSDKENQIDIMPFVKEFARPLLDYQSKQLPVTFRFYADKDVYQVDEPITLNVEFENLTKSNLKVKELSSDSIAFTYDKILWGLDLNHSDSVPINKILRPKRSIRKKFRIKGLSTPQDLAIHATYFVNFKGIRPTETLNLKIVK